MMPVAIGVLVFIPMLIEAVVSARHETLLREMGAAEPPDDVYRTMQVAYPAAFVAVLSEAWLRQVTMDGVVAAGAVIFTLAKGLKYWAIATLGHRWTFRVLVPRDSVRIVSGPYRLLRHPNYVAVVGELAGATLMAHAWISGPIVTIGFGLLLVARIRVEERALGLRNA